MLKSLISQSYTKIKYRQCNVYRSVGGQMPQLLCFPVSTLIPFFFTDIPNSQVLIVIYYWLS